MVQWLPGHASLLGPTVMIASKTSTCTSSGTILLNYTISSSKILGIILMDMTWAMGSITLLLRVLTTQSLILLWHGEIHRRRGLFISISSTGRSLLSSFLLSLPFWGYVVAVPAVLRLIDMVEVLSDKVYGKLYISLVKRQQWSCVSFQIWIFWTTGIMNYDWKENLYLFLIISVPRHWTGAGIPTCSNARTIKVRNVHHKLRHKFQAQQPPD
jgi:hypothetical protein